MKRVSALQRLSVLSPDFQLSVLINDEPIETPKRLTDVGLRYTLIMEHDFLEEDVNQICTRAERNGCCKVRFYGQNQTYVIERVMAS